MFSYIRDYRFRTIYNLNVAYFLLLSIACSKNLDITEGAAKSGNNTNLGNSVSQHNDQDLDPLIQAIKANNIKKVKDMLQDHNYDLKDLDGDTLAETIGNFGSKSCPEMLTLLLQEGANVNVRTTARGSTLLQEAVIFEKRAMVKFLLDREHIDINAKSSGGDTALHYAAEQLEEECVSLLLAKGGNVNAQNEQKETALHKLFKRLPTDLNPQLNLVRTLLAAGANPDIQDHEGKTVLHHVLESVSRGLDHQKN